MDATDLRLRSLPAGARLGVTALLLVLLGGLLASGLHMQAHHENRDERAGLSMDDLRGAYHGLRNTAPLITALEDGHPDDLPEASRELLLGWLRGERISEDYDSLELGDAAPAEVLDGACLSCHARQSEDPIGQELPLEYWDDVAKVAFSREVAATGKEVLLASTHTHALALGSLGLVVALLALLTRWPRGVIGWLVGAAGVGLLADLACWWLARSSLALVPVLVAAGALFALSTTALILLAIADLWLPRRAG